MENKSCVRCNIMKPLTEFGKRAASLDGLQFRCRACRAEVLVEERKIHGVRWNAAERERYWANPEGRAVKIARYKERMKDKDIYAKKRAKVVEWLKANPGKTAEYSKRHYSMNTDRKRESSKSAYWRDPIKERQRMMVYQKNNLHVYAANEAARRAIKLEATPPWVSHEQRDLMKCFYIVSDILTNFTGKKHHVDHIHPLKGISSRGLHVPWNLRVITAFDNMSKGNKMVGV